jgi:hypothetical protein
MTPEHLSGFIGRDDVLPLASAHGGFVFVFGDPVGLMCELHTLFTPEGWGREAADSAVLAFNAVFALGPQMVTTHEVKANPRSRPPLSYGFRPAGGWGETPYGCLRLWILTAVAWAASPVATRRRRTCH